MKATCLFGAMLVVGLTACDGGGGSGAGGSSSTSTGGAGGSTAPVECTGGAPSFPEFDRTCATEADCVVAFHQINCCGTRDALGIAKGEKAAFDAAEATCESQYPGCGCAQGPTTTDEGSTSVDENMIQVQCASAKCMSYVP